MDEKLYSIKEQTLIDIGDALRRKLGETVDILVPRPEVIAKTPHSTSHDDIGVLNETLGYHVIPVRITGASSIKVIYSCIRPMYSFLFIAPGFYTTYDEVTQVQDGRITIPLLSNIKRAEYIFENTDSVSFAANGSDTGVIGAEFGYYAEVIGLDENGEEILFDVADTIRREYTSAEMAAAIDDIKPVIESLEVTENGIYEVPEGVDGYGPITVDVSLGDIEPIVLSGDCSYSCAGPVAGQMINMFGNKITTENITNGGYMFYDSGSKGSITNIPFDLNFKTNTDVMVNQLFANQVNLTQIGNIVNLQAGTNMGSMFYNCYKLRHLPNFINLNMATRQTSASGGMSNTFQNCYSLRSIPEEFLKQYYSTISSRYSSHLYYLFYNCASLDEIKGLMTADIVCTSDMFGSMMSGCCRIKDFTFATQEDGTPFVRRWQKQNLSFTTATAGYAGTYRSYILNYNSGITADKEVTDDATYQALKNDPDWWTANRAYSRYNHDSAVNTINSLPDASAYLTESGGVANQIRFYGDSGSKTDGGAVNTLTEEEIAVAVSKGWSVTFV